MKRPSLVCAVLIAVGISFVSARAEDLQIPNDPIQPYGPDYLACKTYGFLEGADDCSTLEFLGEPPEPVTDKDTRLAFRLIWGRGDRKNETIVLRFEIQSPIRGFFAVHQEGNGHIFLDGRAPLTSDDIAAVVRASARQQFWTLANKAETPSLPNKDGVEQVLICYDGFTLAGMKSGVRQVLSRRCPMQGKPDPAVDLARAFLKIARKHFPDWATEKDFWGDVI